MTARGPNYDPYAQHRPQFESVRVTRRQARLMAEAIWTLEQTARQYAEIAHIRYRPTVQDQIMLAEIRRRLYLAAGPK